MTETEAIVALNAVPDLGPRIIHELVSRFGSARAVFEAGPERLRETVQIGPQRLSRLMAPPDMEFAGRQLQTAAETGVTLITFSDPGYPEPLSAIHDPPPVLYVQGELSAADLSGVAVVGSRTPSPYGRRVARDIASALARAGITVISGLARGIDAEAHEAALKAGGRTLAVLGWGLDVDASGSRHGLYNAIPSQGALITEFPFGTPPEPGHFPRRNRIVSGLSRAVVVVEAAAKSGALITARFALEQGRDVYAVPGPIDSHLSHGTNRLLSEGAAPVLSPAELVTALTGGLSKAPAAQPAPLLDPAENRIVALLSATPLHIDDIARQSRLPVTELHPVLLSLEIKGVAAQRGGMSYVRA